MQPWIYSLYLEAFERKRRSYILKDRAMKRHGEWGNSENMNCRESFEQSSNSRTTQFSKRIKMESQVHFDLENFFHIKILTFPEGNEILTWEFDPGSGWTLAACLTHASRTGLFERSFRSDFLQLSGGRVSNAWITCLSQGDSSWKRLVIPHTLLRPHDLKRKDLSVRDGSASD